jgi:hypothetical protein
MSRIVVLTEEAEHLTVVGQHLAAAGGVIANLADSVVTVIMPTLGPVVANCVVGDEWADRLARYGDAVGVAILAGTTGSPHLTGLESLTSTARRAFGSLPVAVGLPAEPNDALLDWLAVALNRSPASLPVYRIDTREPMGVLVLLATLLALAEEQAR